LHTLVALLLLRAGVESNPGPAVGVSKPKIKSLNFGLLNINSALHKAANIHDIIDEYSLDCLALTETRLQADLPSAIKDDIAPGGFSVRHVHRSPSARHPLGGGVALISRDSLTVKPHTLTGQLSPTSFELLLARITSVKPSITVAVVYRPPDSSISQFISELSDVLGQVVAANTDRLLLCGDMNCPSVNPTSVNDDLIELLDVLDLRQYVSEPTRLNHLLDVIAADPALSVSDVRVVDTGASDHMLVAAAVDVAQAAPPPIATVRCRNIRQIDTADFERRLRLSSLFTAPADTVDAYADQIQSVVTAILDEVAPLRHIRRRLAKSTTHWLSDDAVKAKRHRRRLEKQWKKSGLESDRVAYRKACRHANKLINSSRSDHIRQQLSAASDCKTRWKIAKELLHSNSTRNSSLATDSMCIMFANFFHSKIMSLKQAVADTAATLGRPPTPDPAHTGPLLDRLPSVQPQSVLKIINSIKAKTSAADFVPTSLIKSCSSVFFRNHMLLT